MFPWRWRQKKMTETANIAASVIDESMMGLSDLVGDLIQPMEDAIADGSVSISSISLDLPVQLDVAVSNSGKMELGITPPLYKIQTSFESVFHQLKFKCEIEE